MRNRFLSFLVFTLILIVSFLVLSCSGPGPIPEDTPDWYVGIWISEEPTPGYFIFMSLLDIGEWNLIHTVDLDDPDSQFIGYSGPDYDVIGDESNGLITIHDGKSGSLDYSYTVLEANRMRIQGFDFEYNVFDQIVYRLDSYSPPPEPAPTGFVASQNESNKVELSWDSHSGAYKYCIYRASIEDGLYEKIATLDSFENSFTNDLTTPGSYSIVPGIHYSYKISVIGRTMIEGDFSDAAEGWAKAITIIPPSSVSASNGTSTYRINLSWSTVADAVRYNIFRSTSLNGTYSLISWVEGTTTTYNSTSSPSSSPITMGSHYFYKISSIDSESNESPLSSADEGWTETLSAPSGLIVSQGTSTSGINVSWSSVSHASSYELYYSTSEIGTYYEYYSGSATSRSVTGRTPGRTYFFRVRSVDADGNVSLNCMPVSGWEAIDPPANPSTEPMNTAGYLRVYWTDNTSGESGFRIYRSASENGTYSLVKTVSSNTETAVITGMTNYTQYYFKICAYNSYRESERTLPMNDYIVNPPSSLSWSGSTFAWSFSWPGGLESTNDAFLLEYRDATGEWKWLDAWPRDSTSATISKTTGWSLRIRAITIYGTSDWAYYIVL